MSPISTRVLTLIIWAFMTSSLSRAFSPLRKTFVTSHSTIEDRRGRHLRLAEDDLNFSYFDSSENNDSNPSSCISTSNYLALEAFSLEQPKENPARQRRVREENETRKRFVYGNELLELRSKVKTLKEKMQKFQRAGMKEKVAELREEVKMLLVRDAEFMYGQAFALTEQAHIDNREDVAKKFYQESLRIRACLPHFNIEGLWVGKYGDHGYEMINVTYVGDTLVATKVTGEKNVPKGEVSFTADLRPSFHSGSAALAPIELSQTASQQWGTKGLMRFPGKGQVAAEGYVNAKWTDGQLIMVGEEYFSFAWVPIGFQIFFGRPSPELTLKMIKQSSEGIAEQGRAAFVKGDVETMRAYVNKCLEVTEQCLEDDIDGDHFQ